MNLIILVAPGSGKGTSATVLREKFNLAHISTGDLFRYNIKENTPLGIEAKSYIDKGALVPDDVTIRMVEDRLSNPDCEKGYILDGFPRNIAQAEALDKMLAAKGSKIDAVVYVNYMPTKVEGVCDVCGGNVIQRSDDNPETVAKRLETYRVNTQPLIDFYNERGIIVEGNNNVDSDACIASIEAGLKNLGL